MDWASSVEHSGDIILKPLTYLIYKFNNYNWMPTTLARVMNKKDSPCFQGPDSLMENWIQIVLVKASTKYSGNIWEQHLNQVGGGRGSQEVFVLKETSSRNGKYLSAKYPWQFKGTDNDLV